MALTLERVVEVRVDGRERDALQAAQLARGDAVAALQPVVHQHQRHHGRQQPRQPVHGYCYCT